MALLEYDQTVGMTTMEGRGFYAPTDTAIGKDQRLYVVNRSLENVPQGVRVVMSDISGEFFGVFGFYGEGDGEFLWASGAAVDSQGRVYIGDEYLHRISVFDAAGGFLSKWGVQGAGEGELEGPSGLAFDSDDNLYVSDTHNHRVQVFTSEGRYLRSIGSQGEGNGQLNLPWGLTVGAKGDLYVADWGNDRIQRFSANGEYLTKYGATGQGDGQFHRPSSVAVDEEGYIYVADWGNERVQVLDPKGGFEMKLRGEATLSAWAEIFLKSNTEEAEARARANLEPSLTYFNHDPHEESSHIEKYFWSPVSVKLDGVGRLYVTEGNRHRIQVYKRGSS